MSEDPVEKQLDAYNAKDIQRFMECYDPNVVVETIKGDKLMEGHDAMREAYSTLFANSPALHAEVVSRIRVGDYVIDEEQVTGRSTPDGPENMHAAAVYRIRNGLIDRVLFIV